jgi:D-xylose transport system ATP-binding protein
MSPSCITRMRSLIRSISGISDEIIRMDEPTAALGPEETRMAGQLIKRLKTQGVGIILISHDINDVFDLSVRLTIMAGGRVVDTLLTKTPTKMRSWV